MPSLPVYEGKWVLSWYGLKWVAEHSNIMKHWTLSFCHIAHWIFVCVLLLLYNSVYCLGIWLFVIWAFALLVTCSCWAACLKDGLWIWSSFTSTSPRTLTCDLPLKHWRFVFVCFKPIRTICREVRKTNNRERQTDRQKINGMYFSITALETKKSSLISMTSSKLWIWSKVAYRGE